MAWGKNTDQKQAEETMRDEAIRGQMEAWAIGQAMAARQNGDRLFQIQLPVSELAIHERGLDRDANSVRPVPGAGGLLGRIEMIGWARARRIRVCAHWL